jgi:hypothetical protein
MAELRKGSDAVRREFYNSIYTPADEIKRDIFADSRALQALKAEIMAPPVGAQPAVDRRKEQQTGSGTEHTLHDTQPVSSQTVTPEPLTSSVQRFPSDDV